MQTAIIVNTAGPVVLKAYDQWTWDNPGDNDKPLYFWSKLESLCIPRKNEVIESSRFWNAEQSVPFDSWLTELRTKMAGCNIQEPDRMMRDKIVFTVKGKFLELLIHVREDDLDLKKTIKICRAFEQSNQHVQELRLQDNSAQKVVQKFNSKGAKPKATQAKNTTPAPQQGSNRNSLDKICKFCGNKHEWIKEV